MNKVLILGGGFGGVEVYKQLHDMIHPAGEDHIHIELINKTNYFTFSPMLHEVATGSVPREHAAQPLREILSCCGRDFHQATITGVDPDKRIVRTDRGDHSYDILVAALGVQQGFFNTPGAQEHAIPLKTLANAVDVRNKIIRSFEYASEMHDKNNMKKLESYLNFIIVGGGPTGTELAGQLADLARGELKDFYGDVPNDLCTITLVHAGDRLLEHLSPKASKKAKQRLERMGVRVLLSDRVIEVTRRGVILQSCGEITAHNIFWTAGTQSGLEDIFPQNILNERGLIPTEPTFQVPGHPEIFALGDCACASDPAFAYPPTAQAAVQAARVVSKNIARSMQSKSLKQRAFRNKGDVIPIGDWYGIYERGRFRFFGKGAWLFRRAVFIKTMYGFSNRLQIIANWIINIFLPRDTSEL